MAKVKTINVEASFTKNLGNYQSVRIVAGAVLEIGEKDKVQEVYDNAWIMVGREMHEQLELFHSTEKNLGAKK